MRIAGIRSHLTPFRILAKRRTTIANAFASAIAPAETYDLERVRKAIALLGQSEGDIRCVYCDGEAQTWDHLVGLVRNGRFSGFGHILGNLVPCCKRCNSAKGNQDWKAFLSKQCPDEGQYGKKLAQLQNYQAQLGAPGVQYLAIKELAPEDLARYEQIEEEVLQLLKEADEVAARVRSRMADS